MSSIFFRDGEIVPPRSITSIPSSIAVLDNMVSMTCSEILSRAGLPYSNTANLHPPPLPPSRFITCADIRFNASLHIFEMVAPKLAQRVFAFVNQMGLKCKHGSMNLNMNLNMYNKDHSGDVTLACKCGLLVQFGSMDYFEKRNMEVCLGSWDREEAVLKDHLERLEVTARRTQEFEKIINELAVMKEEREQRRSILQSK